MNLESAIVIFRLTVCTISGCVRQRQMTQEGAAEYARKTQSRQITEFRANKLLRHLFSANSETRKINRLIRRYSNGLSGAEAEEGEDGGTDGEYAGKEHRVMRSLVPEEMEKQGYEGCTGCLACQACRGKHAARAAGPVVGRRAQEQVVVGGLEETETGTAHHKPPCDIQMRGVFRNVRQQETSGAHEQQAEDNGIEQRILEVELPAGSISGAPKCATVKAIEEAEQYDRDYYTGIFGYFDGSGLKTAVLIRYIGLASDGRTYFYSGGGITVNSRCEDEYKELCDKVYVPWM